MQFVSIPNFVKKNKYERYQVDKYNFLGLRGGQLPNTFADITLCCGCSVTYGWDLLFKDTYPKRLESKIKKINNNTQVLNFGKIGYGLEEIISKTIDLNKKIKIKNIVLQLPEFIRQKRYVEYIYDSFAKHFNYDIHSDKEREEIKKCLNKLMFYDIKRLKFFQMYCKKKGINLIILNYIFYHKYNFYEISEFYNIYSDMVLNLCKEQKILSTDIIYAKDLYKNNFLIDQYVHPNEDGCEFFAKKVYEIMEKENYV